MNCRGAGGRGGGETSKYFLKHSETFSTLGIAKYVFEKFHRYSK